MTICEFYTVIGGNYDEVLGRLQHEELVRRFVKRFLTDRTHENLVAARNNNDVASAFRAAKSSDRRPGFRMMSIFRLSAESMTE